MFESTSGTGVLDGAARDSHSGDGGRILVVDDEERIRSLLAEILGAAGHATFLAADGKEALELLGTSRANLVLLDIHMPGMDGTEVLARMQRDPEMRDIPVIIITGYHDISIAEKCLRLGAVDYVEKPFKSSLLTARVEGCLARHRLRERDAQIRDLLEKQNRRLEEAVSERTRELREAHERLAALDSAKDDFLSLIAHELRTPVTGLQAAGQILVEGGLAEEERKELAGILQSSLERLSRLVEDALALTRIRIEGKSTETRAWPIESILREAAESAAPFALPRGVTIRPVPPTDLHVPCDPALVSHAFASLLESASRFCDSGGEVTVSVESRGADVVVRVGGSGPELSPDVVRRLLGVFSVIESVTPAGDLGLGLPLAARILLLFGGMVGVTSPKTGGVLFTARLPVTEGER